MQNELKTWKITIGKAKNTVLGLSVDPFPLGVKVSDGRDEVIMVLNQV